MLAAGAVSLILSAGLKLSVPLDLQSPLVILYVDLITGCPPVSRRP